MDTELLNQKADEINAVIYAYLPAAGEFDGKITEAMAYSVKAGGKRLRPMLMRESFRMFAGEGAPEPELLHVFMAAMECMHTYSLVHDDLPAIDNDRYRRGKLTTHAAYGEAYGVFAGDALLNYAFELIAGELDVTEDPVLLKRGVRALRIFASKSGIYGMLGGQCLDVESEKNADSALGRRQLEYVYKNKTAAFLEASVMIGSVLAGADESAVSAMEQAAFHVGMAFQIRDDILDVTGTEEELGKPIGSDEKNGKATFATILGPEKAQKEVERYTGEAVRILDEQKVHSAFLKELFLYLIQRNK